MIGKMQLSKNNTIMSMLTPAQLGLVAFPLSTPIAKLMKSKIAVWKVSST
jgi:hypothetical protein